MEILLFQIRNPGDPMRQQEERCFLRKLEPLSESTPWRLSVCNIVTEPVAEISCWERFDVVMVGGSGSYGCVNNGEAWFEPFCAALRGMVEKRKPLFCSCFGHQALAVALGGAVITDKARAELGTLPLRLNEAGLNDPLFAGFPQTFEAQFGHNDQVSRMPAGAVLLASSELCEVQAYRLEGLPIYATQFHPELDHLENRERASVYLKVYDPELTKPESLQRLFRPTPEASRLLSRFVELTIQQG